MKPDFEVDIPVLFGGGVEFFVTPNVSLSLRLRLGPAFYAGDGYSGVRLGLDMLAGVAVRI